MLGRISSPRRRPNCRHRFAGLGSGAGPLIRNPIVIALITELAVSLLGLGVPGIIAKPIELLAGIPVADQRLADAAVLLAAMPAMGIYSILTQRYRQQRTAALAMLMMTALSFFSISAVLGLLKALPPG
jgi:predicted permease